MPGDERSDWQPVGGLKNKNSSGMNKQPTNDRPVVKLEIEVTPETAHDVVILITEEGWMYQ